MRKSKLIVLAGVVVLGVASVTRSQAPTTSGRDLAKENAALRAENARLKRELQERIDRLEGRTDSATTRPFDWRIDPGIIPPGFRFRLQPRSGGSAGAATRPYSFRLTPSKPMFPGADRSFNLVPDENNVPQGWEKREFNGQPFYLIPLGASAQRSTSAAAK